MLGMISHPEVEPDSREATKQTSGIPPTLHRRIVDPLVVKLRVGSQKRVGMKGLLRKHACTPLSNTSILE